jgi:signal transduction histidine kinase
MSAVMQELPRIEVNGHAAKVLIVDDDSTLRSLIRTRLKKSGYEVIEAGNGRAAVDCFVRVQPDIVLMDANMPGMDGFEATQVLKGMPQGRHTPILMVSGLEDDDSVDKAFEAGATEYITKPICWPLLMHRLENICSALQAEANLIRAKLIADEANRAKTEFLANMSHELRTPMHAILSFASMGTEKIGKATDEKLHRYFSRIEESGKRLLMMLNDLLDLSKLEAGKMIFLMDYCDLVKTSDQVLNEFHALIAESEITVSVITNGINTRAWFDCDRILQVITNLVSNAVKFSPAKSELQILFNDDQLVLQDEKTVDAVRLTVKDQGIGIPAGELESVFDKFVQSSETNTGAGGTGLGLAICKQIVEYHQGKIYAENNSDVGTSFQLVPPRNAI